MIRKVAIFFLVLVIAGTATHYFMNRTGEEKTFFHEKNEHVLLEIEEDKARAKDLAEQFLYVKALIDKTERAGKVFHNENKGMYWSDRSIFTMKQSVAKEFCSLIGGKLPTISELRTLIKNCPDVEPEGKCRVTDECRSFRDCRDLDCGGCPIEYDGRYSVFGDTGWFWSSSEVSDIEGEGWLISFDDAFVYNKKLFYHRYIRCLKE
jgi:hypothetical protein